MVPLSYLQIGRTEIRSICILPFAFEIMLGLASMNALRWFLRGDNHNFGETITLFSAWMATPKRPRPLLKTPNWELLQHLRQGLGWMEPQNFLQRGLVTAQCECPRWFSHTSRLCAFLGRTKTLYFFGPITCCLTPGFLNGATFPPTK